MSDAVVQCVRAGMSAAGYREDLERIGVPVAGSAHVARVVAYSDRPLDARTAAICIVDASEFSNATEVATLREIGAPLVIAYSSVGVAVWQQRALAPRVYRWLKPDEVPDFFHRKDLSPEAVYRAKTWGRFEPKSQLEFVDVGLVPLVEQEAGQKLTRLIEQVVISTKMSLGWTDVTTEQGRWLLKSHFWLLAARILKDKEVTGFARLDLGQLDTVYTRLANHYDSKHPNPPKIGGKRRREALEEAAAKISAIGNCSSVTTESLGQLYESALIDEATRHDLGTHSTPTWLVDYIVGRLRDWIRDIPAEERNVFEPACGHAGFLVSAMRLLSELLPRDSSRADRRQYLRKRLTGMDVDSFALEVARLSMTLADVPNSNGWTLDEGDMFDGDELKNKVSRAQIVLANPPFEPFSTRPKESISPNKAAETFARIVKNLPQGGVIGLVLPQAALRTRAMEPVRDILLRDYEIQEISLFTDNVFRYGESEVAVLLARRATSDVRQDGTVRYQRIGWLDVEPFSRTYVSRDVEYVEFEHLKLEKTILPGRLAGVWSATKRLPRLSEIADIGKGFEHYGDDDMPSGAARESDKKAPGMEPGFSGWSGEQFTHLLPRKVWLNTTKETIRRSGKGLDRKPQVLVNYGRVSREPWRIKALLDPHGHVVTSRFVVICPRDSVHVPLLALWAILNSPVANAFVWGASAQRDVLVTDLNDMPVPDLLKADLEPLLRAAQLYLDAANAAAPASVRVRREPAPVQQRLGFEAVPSPEPRKHDAEVLRALHWKMDAEVLKLYGLPSALERKLLDLFTGVTRRGVPFIQNEYVPASMPELERLHDLIDITVDWPLTRDRRGQLIDLDIDGKASADEVSELGRLERLAAIWSRAMAPLRTDILEETLEKLKGSMA